jgi:beta-exotoxin I transport system ATP-binding protein
VAGDAAIEAEALTKTYRGGARGVEDLSFRIAAGEVFGFLGPNGAGKSTTIRLMLDLIRPTSGRLEILGRDARRGGVAIRARTGYLPGDLRLYPRMTARDLVGYFAHLRRMPDTGDAQDLARRLDLDLDRPLRSLSRGNRQKVGLVQAFMHRPELLVLDEPTSGLDPLMQQAFAALTRETTDRGGTVFLSSHVLSEVQHVAHRVGVVREGRLELIDTVEALRARAATRVEVTFGAPPPDRAFEGLAGVRVLERSGPVVIMALDGSADALVKRLAGFEVIAIDSHEADLEDVFLGLYRSETPRAA